MRHASWGMAALLCLGTTSAFSAEPGVYFTGNLGLVMPMDEEADEGGINYEVSYKEAIYVSGTIGYDFGNNVRLELEVAYANIEGDEISASDGVSSARVDISDANVSTLLVTAGAYYDFQVGGSFKPYIGGGAGFARTDMDDFTAGGVTFEGDSDTNLAAFAEAGLGVGITESVDIVPAYRFLWINNGDEFEDSKAHILKVGARFRF